MTDPAIPDAPPSAEARALSKRLHGGYVSEGRILYDARLLDAFAAQARTAALEEALPIIARSDLSLGQILKRIRALSRPTEDGGER